MKEEETFCYFTGDRPTTKGSIKKCDIDESLVVINNWEWDETSPTGIGWSPAAAEGSASVNWIDIAVDFIAREFPDHANMWIEEMLDNTGKFPERHWIKALRIARDKRNRDPKNGMSMNYIMAVMRGMKVGQKKKREEIVVKMSPEAMQRAKEAAQRDAERFAAMAEVKK